MSDTVLLRAPLKCRRCNNAKGILIPVKEPRFQRTRGKRPTWQLKGFCDICEHGIQGFVSTKFAEEHNAVDDRLEHPPVEGDTQPTVEMAESNGQP